MPLDPDQAEALTSEAARRAGSRREEFLRGLLAGAAGREWMWHQLTTCDIFGNVFSPDAAVTAFNLGRQDWGKRMFAEILSLDPQSYILMSMEEKEREDALRRELHRAARGDDRDWVPGGDADPGDEIDRSGPGQGGRN